MAYNLIINIIVQCIELIVLLINMSHPYNVILAVGGFLTKLKALFSLCDE